MKQEDIENIFTYHPPTQEQAMRYTELRRCARVFAGEINKLCPESAEKTLAIRRLQESVMYANASIAINEGGKHNE